MTKLRHFTIRLLHTSILAIIIKFFAQVTVRIITLWLDHWYNIIWYRMDILFILRATLRTNNLYTCLLIRENFLYLNWIFVIISLKFLVILLLQVDDFILKFFHIIRSDDIVNESHELWITDASHYH